MALVTETLLPLTQREVRVARLYAIDGLSVAEVAAACGLSPLTVKSYLKRIRQKYRTRGVTVGTVVTLQRALIADGYGEQPPAAP